MKTNVAVVEFKSKADRLAGFLKEKGHNIPHLQLMEGLALYEGYRDWRTFRAVLAGDAGQHKPTLAHMSPSVMRIGQDDIRRGQFLMADKTVTVYLQSLGIDGKSTPVFCKLIIDQQWVESLYTAQEMSGGGEGTVRTASLAPQWVPADLAWAMRDSVGNVSYDTIWFSGVYSETWDSVNTEEYKVEDLLTHVAKAIQAGESEVYLIPEGLDLQALLHDLGKLRIEKPRAPTTEKFVTAHFNAFGCGVGPAPDFCSVDVTAGWLSKLLEMQAESQKKQAYMQDTTLGPVWQNNEKPWAIKEDGLVVQGDVFWFYAKQKFGPRIETHAENIQVFVEKLAAALAAGGKGPELYFLQQSNHDRLMEQLGRKPGHPQYVGRKLSRQENWALSSCLSYWGDLSYSEVLAILDGEWEGQRDLLDAKDAFVGFDDEALAQEIRNAHDAYGF